MTETFAALLFAHVLADFGFQSARMAAGKAARDPAALAAHIAMVAAVSAAALGAAGREAALAAAAVTAAHLAIDLAKSFARPGLGAFLADQAAHLVSLAVAAALWPGAWAAGPWAAAGADWLPAAMALAAGFVIATRAGGFALGLLMAPFGEVGLAGLPNGGRLIGLLERGLIFVLILTGEAGGIGFLIAAKSVLRFGAVKEEARLSEYVIIGTLASFGWAIVASAGTLALLAALPPLGIPDLSP